jgi:hypothetical protein
MVAHRNPRFAARQTSLLSGNGAVSDKYVIGILAKGMTDHFMDGRDRKRKNIFHDCHDAKCHGRRQRTLPGGGMDGYISQTSPPEQLFRAIEDSVLVRKET